MILARQASTNEHRAAITDWLTILLHERFSPDIMLTKPAANVIYVSCLGSAGHVCIRSDDEMFTRTDSDLPYTEWDAHMESWQAVPGSPLPAPGASALPRPLIESDGLGYRIHYDILGLTYWMLSRQEEVGRVDLDGHDRFPAKASHAFKHDYLERPVVDEWLAILGQVMQRVWPQLKLAQHRFSMKVSHDVDTPARYGFCDAARLLRTMVGDVARRRNLHQAFEAPGIWLGSKEKIHSRDPFNTFDWIMDASEQSGLTSAFYFICGRTHPTRDALYDGTEAPIRELMRRIHARGHEIGLHPSYNTFRNPQAIVSEARRLKDICREEGIEQAVWGGRMHYLRWHTPTTLYGWEQAGMSYDSTLSYADRPGFRCGTCHEYPAFDPVAGKSLKLRIRPLIAMECTVMAPRFMNLGSGQAALDKFTKLKEACRAVNGVFTLLWHNTLLERQIDKALYKSLLPRPQAETAVPDYTAAASGTNVVITT